MGRDWTLTDQADAADDRASRERWMRFPRDHDTDQCFCPQCGEPCDGDVSVEAFEEFGEAMCSSCASDMFEQGELPR